MLAGQVDAASSSSVNVTGGRPLTAAGPGMRQIFSAKSGAIHPVIEMLPRVEMAA
jgi:hypothetical protein